MYLIVFPVLARSTSLFRGDEPPQNARVLSARLPDRPEIVIIITVHGLA